MDALVTPEKHKRRKRYERRSTGKRVTAGDYETIWFQKLRERGPLSTPYLTQYTEHLLLSESTIKHRLGDLYHENNTPYGSEYLNRPKFQNRKAKELGEIHELDRAALEHLKARGLAPLDSILPPEKTFPHRFMTSSIVASAELSCPALGVTFVSGQELLGPNRSLNLPTTFLFEGVSYTIPVVPDDYFGFRYSDGSVRAFLVESDRHNEPIVRRDMENQSSYLRKMLQYEYLMTWHNGEPPPYHKLLGIQCGLVVLNITMNFEHMNNIIKAQKKYIGPSTYMLFRTLSVFADEYAVPPVLTELLTTPCQRAGHSALDISKP
jgi:hypothetical protein